MALDNSPGKAPEPQVLVMFPRLKKVELCTFRKDSGAKLAKHKSHFCSSIFLLPILNLSTPKHHLRDANKVKLVSSHYVESWQARISEELKTKMLLLQNFPFELL